MLDHLSEKQLIIEALSTPITRDEILGDSSFGMLIDGLAKRIYATDQRDRSLEKIRNDCLIGKRGELGTCIRLKNRGLSSFWNVESLSGAFHYDLICGRYKIEVKYQSRWQANRVKRECFSFDEVAKVKTAMEKWRSYDFILGWYQTSDKIDEVWQKNDDVCPWVLIDHRALDPALDLFSPSRFQGYYLKMNIAVDPHHFKNPLHEKLIDYLCPI